MLTLTMAEAQSGYIYRSINSGAWSNYSTWERAAVGSPNTFIPLGATDPIPHRGAENIEISDGNTVVFDVNTNIDQLYVKPGGVFELPSGKQMNVYVAPATDRIIVQGVNGKQGIFRNLGGSIVFKDPSNVTVSSNIVIDAYGKYEHAYDASVGTIPTATWDINSEIEFKMTGVLSGLTLADYQSRGFNQNFGNIKWNTSGNTNNLDLKGVITNVQANFEVVSTGTGASGSSGSALILSSSGTYSLNIGKSLIVSGSNSDLVLSSSGAPSGGSLTMTIGEGMNIKNGGAFRNNKIATPLNIFFTGPGLLQNTSTTHLYNVNYEVGSGANITLGADLTVPGAQSGGSASNFVVKGIFKTENYIVSGNGNFSLDPNAYICVGSATGLSSGSAGSIRVGGTRSFSSSANYIYNGTSAQVTGTALPATVKGLAINNAAGLTLSAPVFINNSLEMTEGVITTSSANKIVIGSSGSVVMPVSNKVSYISGPMSHTVDNVNFDNLTVLNFPVGKNGKYRPIELTVFQLDPLSTTYTAEQFEQAYAYPPSESLPSTVENISTVRYFKIDKSTNADVTAQVKLVYAADDMVTDYQKLTIAKYNSVNKWVDILATASANGTITSDFFDNFSDFVLANKTGGTNPLPVELLSFNAQPVENAIALTWETASEKNSSHFEIQRSQDARTFETIGSEKAQGNSQNLKRYAFDDKNPLTGLSYYRLKQVDLDGTVAYSKIEQVNNQTGKLEMKLYPNPTTGNLTISLPEIGAADVKVMNVLGQVVLAKKVTNTKMVNMELTHFPAGTYQVVVLTDKFQIVKKVIKTAN